MYTKPRYSLKDVVLWTRGDTLVFLAISAVPVILYELMGLKLLHLPWLPVAPSFSCFNRRSYVSSRCEA